MQACNNRRAEEGANGLKLRDTVNGARLKRRLDDLGDKVQDAAAAVGVDKATLYRWAEGQGSPKGESLARLCERLGVSAQWLFVEDGQEGEADYHLARAVQAIETGVSPDLAVVVRQAARLLGDPEQLRRLAARVQGWIDAQEDQPLVLPPSAGHGALSAEMASELGHGASRPPGPRRSR